MARRTHGFRVLTNAPTFERSRPDVPPFIVGALVTARERFLRPLQQLRARLMFHKAAVAMALYLQRRNYTPFSHCASCHAARASLTHDT